MITRNTRPLFGKLILTGKIRAVTGLHIGGPEAELKIGGIDSFVIKDPIGIPYIPGSSLKGKLRDILERKRQAEDSNFKFDHQSGTQANPVYRHECMDKDEKEWQEVSLKCPVCRLFGKSRDSFNIPSRLIVRDSFLDQRSKEMLERIGSFTEVKGENTLDRITSAANPRFIERIPPDTVFNFEMVYNIESTEDLKEDMNNLSSALQVLEDDGIGGHVSRGYGKVSFEEIKVTAKKIDFYRTQEDRFIKEVEIGHPSNLKDRVQEIQIFFGS